MAAKDNSFAFCSAAIAECVSASSCERFRLLCSASQTLDNFRFARHPTAIGTHSRFIEDWLASLLGLPPHYSERDCAI
jgi:hypothetical protein